MPSTHPSNAPKINREEFRELYLEGWTITALAEKYGVRFTTASRARDRMGLPKKRTHELPQERVEHFRRLLEEGWSYTEISRTEHVSRNTLARYFPGQGWDAQERDSFHVALRHGREGLRSAAYSIPQKDRYLRVA